MLYHQRAILLAALLVIRASGLAQDGANDPTFNAADLGFGQGDGANTTVRGVLVQPDGKLMVWGDLTLYNYQPSNRVCRINADGTPDDTFDNPSQNGDVYALALQADSKVVIGGDFTYVGSAPYQRLLRLNADGSRDASFMQVGHGVNARVNAIGIQGDGKVIVAGAFSQFNTAARNRIARLTTAGALDGTFNPGVGPDGDINAMAVQPDGSILIAGNFLNCGGVPRAGVARLSASGMLDASFDPGTGASGEVHAIHLLADGRVLIAGAFSLFNGVPCGGLALLNTDGSWDTSFDPNAGANDVVYAIAAQPDGKILAGGIFSSFGGEAAARITRLNADGSVDETFTPISGADSTVFGLAVKSDGHIVAVGDFESYDGVTREHVAQLDANGTLDEAFNPSTGADEHILTALVLEDDRILIGGRFERYNGEPRNRIACLNSDGTIDPTFQIGSGADGWVYTIVRQADGKFILAGNFQTYQDLPRNMVVRLNNDGSVDAGFNPPIGGFGSVFDVIVRPDGKILLGGAFYNLGGSGINSIALLETDGSLDVSLNTGLAEATFALALQPDGKLIYGTYSTPRLRRMNVDGSEDATFVPGDGPGQPVDHLVLQPDGKILVAGPFLTVNGTFTGSIIRLLADGTLDPSFNIGDGPGGAFGHSHTAYLQPDGRILLGGNFTSFDSDERRGLTRLLPSGAQDPSFDPGAGTEGQSTLPVTCFGMQSDGRIIVVGGFTSYDGVGRNRIARLTSDLTTGLDVGVRSNGIRIAPNPSRGLFTITGAFEGPTDVTVLDALGRTVRTMRSTVPHRHLQVDLSGEEPGAYRVLYTNASGAVSATMVKE